LILLGFFFTPLYPNLIFFEMGYEMGWIAFFSVLSAV